MKKTIAPIFSFMILVMTASSLSAQGPFAGYGYGIGMHKPFHHLEMMQYTFDLTNAQVDKIYKIEKDYMDKFYQNRNNPGKIKELSDNLHTEFINLLTAEQITKWNDFQKNHPFKGKNKKGPNVPSNRPYIGMYLFHTTYLKKDLGLTDEQTDKIYKIHRDHLDKFYQNRNDYDKIRELRIKQNSEIESILTSEQKAKWKEFRNKPPRFRDKNWKGKGKPGCPCWADDEKIK